MALDVQRECVGFVRRLACGVPSASVLHTLVAQRACRLGTPLLFLLLGSGLASASAQPAAKGNPAIRPVRLDEATQTSAAVVVDSTVPLAYTTQLLPVDERGQVIGP